MARIAYLVSSAREIELADGSRHPTGYFAEEAVKPYERFTAAGAEVVVLTPDGRPPFADPYGLEHFFHYPEEDQDFFASVTRTFHHDPDDIRVTLHQNTELGLVAARRIAALLKARGFTPAEAHALGQQGRQGRLARGPAAGRGDGRDGLDGGLSAEEIAGRGRRTGRRSRQLAAERKAPKLDAIPGLPRAGRRSPP